MAGIAGGVEKIYTFEAMRKRVAEQAQAYFEPQLTELGLSRSQIETQSLEELRQSLESINEAIKNPQSFGVFSFRAQADASLILSSKQSAQLEVGILPLLLDRKKLLLERIKTLSSNEKIENIHDLINRVGDEEVKKYLEKELNSLKIESQQLREQSKEVEKEQNQERIRSQAELTRLSVEIFERRSKVWFSLLERESAATIIGGLMLMIIMFAQVAAIFWTKSELPEILNNAFLIILGYFFGQSTNKKEARTNIKSNNAE